MIGIRFDPAANDAIEYGPNLAIVRGVPRIGVIFRRSARLATAWGAGDELILRGVLYISIVRCTSFDS
jgi:hypothetical protein